MLKLHLPSPPPPACPRFEVSLRVSRPHFGQATENSPARPTRDGFQPEMKDTQVEAIFVA